SGLSNAARRDGELTMQLLDECRNIAPLQATRRNQPKSVVEHAVDFRAFFQRPTYAHFELSGLLEPKTGPTYARMLITALLTIATMIPAAQRRCPVFLIIDEFQLMANASFARFVEMARSIGVTICLATQTIETSKGRDFDLRATIDGNVGVRRYYSSNTPELIKYIQACCGEFIDYEESVHLTPEGTTYSYKPVRRPRMSQNELIVMTADSHCSLVHVHGKFGGFPFFVKTEYSMTKAEYEAMRVAPWPPADGTTVRPLDDPGAAAKPALAPPPPPTKPQQRFPTKLDALGRKRKNRKGKKPG
ncbi:MAG: TraM recognition domain-containing protein, partial [Planctomycetales bacterium]|nr:TraM recognition domain-containing protein [Planctomycetales bacterium]